MGNSLHLVDFLVQNMPTQALDRATLAPSDSTGSGSNTALHLCALHDKAECMKLLLRSGADPKLRNALDKTPLDIAQERGHHTCEELVSHLFVFGKDAAPPPPPPITKLATNHHCCSQPKTLSPTTKNKTTTTTICHKSSIKTTAITTITTTTTITISLLYQ
jgi:hypothetical protein